MGLRKQLGVVGGCFRTLFTHPFSLVYPALTAVSIVGLLLGFAALALFMGALTSRVRGFSGASSWSP